MDILTHPLPTNTSKLELDSIDSAILCPTETMSVGHFYFVGT